MEEVFKLFGNNSNFRFMVILQVDFNINVLGIEDFQEAFNRALHVNYCRYIADKLGFDVMHDDDVM